MTRRHIEAIAAAILHSRSCFTTPEGRAYNRGRTGAAVAIADALEGLNPSFDRTRFLRDCGVSTP